MYRKTVGIDPNSHSSWMPRLYGPKVGSILSNWPQYAGTSEWISPSRITASQKRRKPAASVTSP